MAVWRFGIADSTQKSTVFEPGNKLAKGGKRAGAGRPPKAQQEIKKAAAQIARDYIERSVKPVMHTYFQLAHGRMVNKWHEGQIVGQEFEADAPTTRHFIDKLLPDEQNEPQAPHITVNIGLFSSRESGPELRADSLSIRLNGSNGKNGNGEHSS